jgi:hypothetical protein
MIKKSVILISVIGIISACSDGGNMSDRAATSRTNPSSDPTSTDEKPRVKDAPSIKIKRKVDGPADPFGLESLLAKPYEEFPREIPSLSSLKVQSPLSLRELDDSLLRKLEGTWIGGSRDERFYFKFSLDRNWTALMIRDVFLSDERNYSLLSGSIGAEQGYLKLTVQKFEDDGNWPVGVIVDNFVFCLVHDYPDSTESKLFLKINFEDNDTLVLFMNMGHVKVRSTVLIRKNN